MPGWVSQGNGVPQPQHGTSLAGCLCTGTGAWEPLLHPAAFEGRTGLSWETRRGTGGSEPQVPLGCMAYSSPELRTAGLASQPLRVPSWAGDLCTILVRRSLAAGPVEPWLWLDRSRSKLRPLGEVAGTISLLIRRGFIYQSPPLLADQCWCVIIPLAQGGGPGVPECSPRLWAQTSAPWARAWARCLLALPSSATADSKLQQRCEHCSLPGAQQTVTGCKEQLCHENHC